MEKILKNQKGITLVALIVTIIVLLILAGVALAALLGDSGILSNTLTAKEKTAIANETEIIKLAMSEILASGKEEKIALNDLYEKLKDYNVEITEQSGDMLIKFKDANRNYLINADGKVSYLDVAEAKTITINYVQEDIKGKRTQIKESEKLTVFAEDYSIVPPKIEGYEPALEVVTGSTKDIEEIEILYYLVYDEEELVFTEITVDGEIQYMVGDNSTNKGNGIKSNVDKTIKAVLRIPETFNGKKVTKVGQRAFQELKNIMKLTTGDSVEDIATYAFDGVGASEATIGKSVASTGKYIFNSSNNLKTITFKNAMQSYSGQSFNLTNWTEIKIDKENTAYKVIDNVLYSADEKKLILCPTGKTGEFTIPDNVTTIAARAFSPSKLSKLTISDNVETIGGSAFINSQINEMIIGKNVTKIEAYAFWDSTVTTITFKNAMQTYSGQIFKSKNWTQIKIDEGNTAYKVVDNVLYSADGTRLILYPTGKTGEFTIPDNVTTIAGYAFYSSGLSKVIIPDNLTTIENNAFYKSGIQEATIGKNVTSIGTSAFLGCDQLTSITFKNHMQSYSQDSFNCANWTEIKIDEGNTTYKVIDNVLYSADGKRLILCPTGREGEFTIPDDVTTIASCAFANSKLSKVIIPGNVGTLESKAFYSTQIKEIIIGKNVTNIGTNAFSSCKSLVTVKIDSSTIASQITAQNSCGYLVNYATTIYIKNDIAEIGNYITTNFTPQVTSEIEGYTKYVKKTT